MNNRILAMLLAIIMIIGIVPVTADAATKCKHTDYTTVAQKDATCTVNGNVEYYVCNNTKCGVRSLYKDFSQIVNDTSILAITAPGHSFEWKADETQHYEECAICHHQKTSTKGNHSLTAKDNGDGTHDLDCSVAGCPYEVKAAAHVDGSVQDCKCGYCGAVMHDLKLVEAKEATCKEAGMKAYYACQHEYCVAKFDAETNEQTTTEALTIKRTAHDISWEYKDGKHRQYCADCNTTHKDWADHTLAYKDNEDGTHTKSCETCGYSEKVDHVDSDKNCVCEACGADLAHVYEGWKNDVDGHWHSCTKENCGENFDWAKHTYTYTANEGKHTHTETCTVCNKVKETQTCFDKDGDHYCDGCKALMRHGFTDADVMRKSATCTEDGFVAHYKCAKCSVLFVKEGSEFVPTTAEAIVLKATGHKAKEVISCNDTEHYNLCANGKCTEKLNVEAHKFEYAPNGADTHYAKCSVCGRMPEALKFVPHVDENKDCVCDACGFANDHLDKSKMTYVEYLAPTCTADGHTDYYLCGNCNGKFLSDGSAWDPFLKALGHDWVHKYDTLGGKHIVKCKNCKAYETQSHTDTDGDCKCDIGECDALIHSHDFVIVAKVEPTCTEVGYEAHLKYEACGKLFDANQNPISAPVEIPATGHDWSGEWVGYDSEQHVLQCVNCDEQQFEEHEDADENNYCDVCGVALALKYVAQQDPTCTNIGYKGYWVSEITGRKYADEAGTTLIANPEQIPALGHDLEAAVSTGTAGHVYSCSRCSYTKTENHTNKVNKCFCDVCGETISGHEIEYVEGKAATCTKTGIQDYIICKCGVMHDAASGEIITAPVVIPALNHQYESKWYNDAREGTHSKDCLRAGCNEKISEEHDLTAYDLYSGNLHEWRCSICEYKESEIHADSNGDSICDECGHGSNKAVDASDLDNPRDVITIKGDKDDTTEEKQNTWWKSFVGKLNPSYVGESASSSAPSASVENNVPNGSGVSSGSTSGASQSAATAPSSSTIGSVVNFLLNLLSTLFGI